MKITLTGSLGNITKPLAKILIEAGHKITIISSDPAKSGDIRLLGAEPAIGSVSDLAFLTNAFRGADAIYTMVPPNWTTSNYRQYISETGKVYHDAIKASGLKRVVNLSSIGAHLTEGTGPIAGLYDVEQTLNSLDGVSVKHLRAGLFFVNFFFDIATIQHMGIMGNNYGENARLVMVHPRDIAAVAAQELQNDFTGKSHQYVVSDERRVSETVKVLGTAIGKPQLPWIQFSDEDALAGMQTGGMSEGIAVNYVEMGNAIESGILFKDFEAHKPDTVGATRLEDFASEFAEVYGSKI